MYQKQQTERNETQLLLFLTHHTNKRILITTAKDQRVPKDQRGSQFSILS
uniref:Uncharacterized protein n=1 Tax=Rhizophora mucronata TaxID=61149 RepID=A0A2P2IXY7_RHIMU